MMVPAPAVDFRAFHFSLALAICVLLSLCLGSSAIANEYSPYYDYPAINLTVPQFFGQLNYDLAELKLVEAAVRNQDYDLAAVELKKYFSQQKGAEQRLFEIIPLPSVPRTLLRIPDADRIVRREYRRGQLRHRFEGDIDWLFNPSAVEGYEGDFDKEWTAWLTRLYELPTLTNAYRMTANEQYAKEAIYLMKHFISTLPVPANRRESGAMRDDMYVVYNELSTARRAGNWARSLLALVDSPSLTPEDLVALLKGLYEHLIRMERNPNVSTPNWRAAEIREMLAATVAFPEFSRSTHWREWSMRRLVEEMDEQVYPDGVQIELDPKYHLHALHSFYESAELVVKAGLPLPEEFLERLSSMAQVPIKISRPDGSLPAFNEVSQSRESKKERDRVGVIARLTEDDHDLLWYATSGSKGRRPDYESVALDWSGYYVMRSGWDRDSLYMAVKAGPYGAAHQYEDKLSFELAAYGEHFLIDPGFYVYNYDSPWRKYFVSSLAHNTVVPDGLSQYRQNLRGEYVTTRPNDAIWISEDEFDFLSGVYDSGYADFMYLYDRLQMKKRNIKHQRDILFVKPDFWIVVDWMTPSAEDDEHTYEALFQSMLPVKDDEEGFVVGRTSGPTLGIYPVAPEGDSLEYEVVAGQLEPVRRGWIYSVRDEIEALPTAVVKQRKTGTAGQAYFLMPEKNQQREIRVHSLSVDGSIALGGTLTTEDGMTIKFVAQPQSGEKIASDDLQTTGRLKVFVSDGDREKVIEIP